MAALVTGATGFLGQVLVERLLAAGEHHVRCFTRPGSQRARLEALQTAYPRAQVEVFVGSLGAPDSIRSALRDVGVVHHLAASLRGAPADICLNTVVTSRNLLDAIVASGGQQRVVLVSSFAVYGVADLPRGALVNEETPLEARPEARDLYAQGKLRQEQLFWDYQRRHGFPLVVLRPGVIYGPGGSAFSTRVGLDLAGLFLHLGGDNPLPLSYVENCADALVIAGRSARAVGQVYNVVDDDLPTCATYLSLYRRRVRPVRSVRLPYAATQVLSRAVQTYHRRSRGQLPAIFTPYKTATAWKGNRFDNAKLKALGWTPRVATADGLDRTFTHMRGELAARVPQGRDGSLAPDRGRQLLRRAMTGALPRRWYMVQGPASSAGDAGDAGNAGAVCLTFDDGPHPQHTPALLDVLRERRVPATFFVVGQEAARHPYIVRRMAAEGHAIGDHSYTHGDAAATSARDLVREVDRTHALLAELTGRPSRLHRPPYGKVTAGKLAGLWRSGRAVVLWNVDPKDYARASPEEIRAWFDSHPLRGGDIVLLHDTQPHSAAALAAVIDVTHRRGLVFTTVDRWLG